MFASHLFCLKCKKQYPVGFNPGSCECNAPLLVDYKWDEVVAYGDKKIDQKNHSIWRYKQFLPVSNSEHIASMGEGMTPLLELKQLKTKLGLPHLFLKDDSLMPTGSFKARGASVGVSMAKELGITTIAMPTNGNAGSAWAAYGTKAGLRVILIVPERAPNLYKKEISILGADLFQIPGLITEAGKIISHLVATHNWVNVATFKEPFRIEGKKTLGLEIAEQFNWNLPDTIIVPCGGGLGIIGIYKALTELKKIGWITGKMPRLVAVQSTGCAPIVRAFEAKKTDVEYWENAKTCAFGINAPRPIGAFLTLGALYKTNGTAVAVSDEEMLHAQKILGKNEGIFVSPEGGATLAAAEKLLRCGWLDKQERVVVLNTCTGLKYPELVECNVPFLELDGIIR